MQRMALPVVLTAEGTTYDRTRAFIKVCSAQSLLCSSLNLVRLSVALNGKQHLLRLLSHTVLRDPLAPLRSFVLASDPLTYLH